MHIRKKKKMVGIKRERKISGRDPKKKKKEKWMVGIKRRRRKRRRG